MRKDKKIGQTTMIRFRAQLDKYIGEPRFTCNWHFIPISTNSHSFSSCCPFSLHTSRGFAELCSFCTLPVWGLQYRTLISCKAQPYWKWCL